MIVIIRSRNKVELREFKIKGIRFLLCIIWNKILKNEIHIIKNNI